MRPILKNPWFLPFLVLATPTLASSIDGKWFLHKFGEMRAYHGDFLNVCTGEQFKQCRAVQYGFAPGNSDLFFGETRLSIARVLESDPATYTIEIFIRDLPDDPQGPFTLSIDGKVFQLSADDWQAGSPEGYNVAETISIIAPDLTDTLVTEMKAGNRLRVLYDGYQETHFQLRGITAALAAIETQAAR